MTLDNKNADGNATAASLAPEPAPGRPQAGLSGRTTSTISRGLAARAGAALADETVHGTQNLTPFVGLSWQLGRRTAR